MHCTILLGRFLYLIFTGVFVTSSAVVINIGLPPYAEGVFYRTHIFVAAPNEPGEYFTSPHHDRSPVYSRNQYLDASFNNSYITLSKIILIASIDIYIADTTVRRLPPESS